MKDMGKEPELQKGMYRHYKGGTYEVIGLAFHSEMLTWHVIYQSQERKKMDLPSIWIRPYEMFIETVEKDGKVFPRFKKIS